MTQCLYKLEKEKDETTKSMCLHNDIEWMVVRLLCARCVRQSMMMLHYIVRSIDLDFWFCMGEHEKKRWGSLLFDIKSHAIRVGNQTIFLPQQNWN